LKGIGRDTHHVRPVPTRSFNIGGVVDADSVTDTIGRDAGVFQPSDEEFDHPWIAVDKCQTISLPPWFGLGPFGPIGDGPNEHELPGRELSHP